MGCVCLYAEKRAALWREHEIEKKRINQLNEKRSLILWALRMPI